MDILHVSDSHFQDDKTILNEIVKCNDVVIETAKKDRPDLIVHAGDIFEERYSWDSDPAQRAIDFVMALADIAPLIIIKGTNTHDVGDDVLRPFSKLNTIYPVYTSTKLGQVWFDGERFMPSIAPEQLITARDVGNSPALISCLPSPQKAHLLAIAENKGIKETDFQVADLLRTILTDWGVENERVRKEGIPSILVAHCSALGARTASGQMIGRDIELSVEAIRMAKATVALLGHIHQAQDWGDIFYPGSITRLSFGEPESKGFRTYTLDGAKLAHTQFIETPAREMTTIKIESGTSPEEFLKIVEKAGVSGGNVKIQYSTTETEMHTVDEKALTEALKKSGVESVKMEKTIETVERSRCEGMAATHDLGEKVHLCIKTWNDKPLPGLDEKIVLVQEKTAEEILAVYG